MSASIPVNPAEPWSLAGKTAIVTGGSRGIGKAIAIYLVRKGASKIAITYASNKAAADDTLDKCRALGAQAVAFKVDAVDTAAWPRLITDSLAALDTPTVDILVNNALYGSFYIFKPVAETTADVFATQMLANVYSPVAATAAFLEHAPKYGGRVINISSVASRDAAGDPLMTYSAIKAALDSYTRSFAGHFALERGVTFNSVIVGPTATDITAAAPKEYMDRQRELVSAAPRIGQPEDIAYIVGFLASEEGRWINGAAVSANGGYRTTLAALG